MKNVITYLGILLFTAPLYAQLFTGKVVNELGQPLSAANVYVDATNLGVITNEKGYFEIAIPAIENKLLVISYLGYYPLYINNFSVPMQTYVLAPKNDELEEVLVNSSQFSRKELMRVFRKEFLGNARCKIVNENAVRIKFDNETNTVHAFSAEDLVVINKKLNYTIRFNLVDFEAQFSLPNLKDEYLLKTHFYGTSFFEELAATRSHHRRNRKKAYLGSIQHFFKALYDQKLNENDFKVARKGFVISPENLFAEIDTSTPLYSLYLSTNDAEDNAEFYEAAGLEIPFYYTLTVLYKYDKQTDIKFMTDTIEFDEFGNFSPVEKVLLTGKMTQGRLSSMLPSNFSYPTQ